MKLHQSFIASSLGFTLFVAPVNAAGVDYVKCDAMQNALVRLANTPEMRIVSVKAETRAINDSGYSSDMKSYTHKDDLYPGYYQEAIGQLKRGIGDPGQVAVLKKISEIMAEKEKMGCP